METVAAAGAGFAQSTYSLPTWGVPAIATGLADTKGRWAVANKVAAGVATALAAITMPAPAKAIPAYAAPFRAWDQDTAGTMAPGGLISDASRELACAVQLPHNSEAMKKINELLLARPGTDVGAIAQINALAARSFTTPKGVAPQLEYRVEEEPDGPALFLTVDTRGMDFDEQMRRELAMRELIWADSRLQAAKNYVVISIF